MSVSPSRVWRLVVCAVAIGAVALVLVGRRLTAVSSAQPTSPAPAAASARPAEPPGNTARTVGDPLPTTLDACQAELIAYKRAVLDLQAQLVDTRSQLFALQREMALQAIAAQETARQNRSR
jgi:hypothetical protein